MFCRIIVLLNSFVPRNRFSQGLRRTPNPSAIFGTLGTRVLETRTLASRRGGPNESQGVCSGNQRTLDFHMGAPLLVNGARARIKSMGEQRQLPRQVPRAAGNAAGGAEQSLPNGAQGCWKMLRTIH